MSTNELTTKVKELRELQALIDEASAEAEALKDEIKAAMGDREELRAGEYKITYKFVNSSRFDIAAFKAEMPELYERFINRNSTGRRFTIA